MESDTDDGMMQDTELEHEPDDNHNTIIELAMQRRALKEKLSLVLDLRTKHQKKRP